MLTAPLRVGVALAAAAVLPLAATSPGPALPGSQGRATSIGYQVLRRNIIVNADIWNARPEMMAAGLGFTSIIGVPNLSTSNVTLSKTLAVLAGGTWNTPRCAPGETVPLASYTSAATPQDIRFTYGQNVYYSDGLPVEFSWPILPGTLDPDDFKVTLSNGTSVAPQVTSIWPNFQYNERSVAVLFGHFGNRVPPTKPGAIYPTSVQVVAGPRRPGRRKLARGTPRHCRGIVLHIVALRQCAVIVRHWFEIDMSDCSLEHGARVELRELAPRAHRGSESAAQAITLDRPLWRADLFDRVDDEARAFSVAHYHPRFDGNEPNGRVWDPALTADPWRWLGDQLASLGAASGHPPWPLDPEDATELPMLADQIVTLARRFSPHRCGSAAECFRMTRDVREAVQLMIDGLKRPELLDAARVAPWMTAAAARV